MGDEEWEKQLINGDERAAEKMVQLYYEDILRYCVWHLPNKAVAEDAAQETFLKFFRYLDKYTHRGQLKAYLYRIAANTCTDWLRKRKSEALPEEYLCVEAGYEQAEGWADFAGYLQLLSPLEREIVLLRFAQDLTLREIGETLDEPLRTVQSKLRQALKRLKQEMVKEDGRDG